MTEQERLQRITEEAVLAAAEFSLNKRVHVDPAGGWVLIEQFPLPNGYNYEHTSVLILLPPDYPARIRDWFYCDAGIRRKNGTKLGHIIETLTDKEMKRKGWVGACLHIKRWKPADVITEGHSLLSICQLIAMAFEQWLCE